VRSACVLGSRALVDLLVVHQRGFAGGRRGSFKIQREKSDTIVSPQAFFF
jgi:hypothetical protein